MRIPIEKSQNQDFAGIRDLYERHATRKLVWLAALLALLVLATLYSTATGAAEVSIKEVVRVIADKLVPGIFPVAGNSLAHTVIVELRLPRIFLAILTGMSLAGAGTVMQGILRNPLVDPYTLGLSSGAAFGAALAIVLGPVFFGSAFYHLGQYIIAVSAFMFGTLTMILVYCIASFKNLATETLVLGGVAVGYLFSAGLSALKYVSDDEKLKELVVWLMGGLWGATWETIGLIVLPVLIGLLILWRLAWDINALSAGEEVALNLGVNVKRLRIVSLAVCSLIASITIAFTGIIGFIGLVAPHICRILIGSDNRFLIPCASLMGAILLLMSDTLARTIIAPTEIPVGIVTALIGAPFFIYLLIKKRT